MLETKVLNEHNGKSLNLIQKLLFVIFSTLFIFYTIVIITQHDINDSKNYYKTSYESNQDLIRILESPTISLSRYFPLQNIINRDVNDSINYVTKKKIFFIETHLNRKRKLENPRQACSVESAG
jgi:hypothetical protein